METETQGGDKLGSDVGRRAGLQKERPIVF